MLEKRATVHRPIGHGGLLVEMTGGRNGAKLAATRDSRPAMQTVGGQSDVGRLHRVALKHARDTFGDGTVEGGDVCWIDQRTLAVGRGYRTNDAGIRQLRDLVRDCVDEVVVVPLPHWHGPADVFHLMSMVSPVDRDLFLVYAPLMPVPFREALACRGIELVEMPDSEFETLGCNVLAIAPREVLMVAGNPETRARLERAGVTVHEFAGREIRLKGGGGPTCLTRPLAREAR